VTVVALPTLTRSRTLTTSFFLSASPVAGAGERAAVLAAAVATCIHDTVCIADHGAFQLSEEEVIHMRQTPLVSMMINGHRSYIVCLLRVLPPLRAAHPPCLAHEPSA